MVEQRVAGRGQQCGAEVHPSSGRRHYLEGVEDINELDIEDLLGLSDLVPLEQFTPHERLILNPGFKMSERVGGADADLLLDDTLIEIKTTKNPKLTNEYLHQLVGYLLLSSLGGINGLEEMPIRRLGVYFARHGLLHTFSVDELFATGGFDDLRCWFDLMLAGKQKEQPDLTGYKVFRPKPVKAPSTTRQTTPVDPYSAPVVIVDYEDWLAQSRQ